MRHGLGLGGAGGAEPPWAPPVCSSRPYRSWRRCRENALCSPGGPGSSSSLHLAAHEGCNMHRVAPATFASVTRQDYAETCLAYLPDLNNVPIFSVPGYSGSRKEDTPVSPPVSSSATARFCLISPRELECFSLSIQNVTEPLGSLDTSWPHDASCRLPELPKLRQANRTPGIVFAPTELQWKP